MRTRLQGALVGYGFIAESGHMPEYRRRMEAHELQIVAVADIDARRREAARRALPEVRLYSDYRELLEHEGKLDFVDICVPPYAHAEVARAALSHGVHVLCEKPMAVSPAEAESMVEQAYRSRRVLFPCHNYRHAPVIREVRGLLESGVIGPVHLVTLQTFRTTHARGVKEWNPDWRRERKYAGGGITMDHGSHTFYLAFEWLRSYPSTVSAKGTSLSGHDTEDNLSCTLTFPTGIATAHLTWTAGVRKVLYTLHGERGAITVDDDVVTLHAAHAASGWNAKAQREQNGSELLVPSDWMDASHKDWFGGLFDQFQEAMLEGNYVSSSTIDALQCVRTIQAAYDSSTRQGREVTIAQPSSHNSHARAASAPALAAAGSSSTG